MTCVSSTEVANVLQRPVKRSGYGPLIPVYCSHGQSEKSRRSGNHQFVSEKGTIFSLVTSDKLRVFHCLVETDVMFRKVT